MALNFQSAYNENFDKFVVFANRAVDMGNNKAVARVEMSKSDNTKLIKVVASTTDKVNKIFSRAQVEKDANNTTRDIFRQAVSDLFHGNIPENVLHAMVLGDYDRGKPLSARRILAVKEAIDRIWEQTDGQPAPAPAPAQPAQPAAQEAALSVNLRVLHSIANSNFDKLPEEMQHRVTDILAGLRDQYGTAVVKGNKPDNIVWTLVNDRIRALLAQAEHEGRDVTVDEIGDAFKEAAHEVFTAQILKKVIMDQAAQAKVALKGNAFAIGLNFCQRHPELSDSLRSAANPQAIAQLLEKDDVKGKITAFMQLCTQCEEATEKIPDKVVSSFAAKFGLDEQFVRKSCKEAIEKITAKTNSIKNDILQGKVAGGKEAGFDCEKAYQAKADQEIAKYADYCAKIAELDASAAVKSRLKSLVITMKDVPNLTPAQLLELSRTTDFTRLSTIFAKGMPSRLGGDIALEIMKGLNAKIREMAGPAALSLDDAAAYYILIFNCALAEKQNLAKLFAAARQNSETMEGLSDYCDKVVNAQGDDASLLQSLIATVAESPQIVKEADYLPLVKERVAAVVAESGYSQEIAARVAVSVGNLAEALLAKSHDINELSAFLGRIQAEALPLAAVAEVGARARQEAIDKIVAATGLNRGYVANMLAIDEVSDRNGALKFYYDSLGEAAAEGGQKVSAAEAKAKAEELLAKFIEKKVSAIQKIAGSELTAEDKVRFTGDVLSGPNIDAEMVDIVTQIANSEIMQRASVMFARIMDPAKLDQFDDQSITNAYNILAQGILDAVNANQAATEYFGGMGANEDKRTIMQEMVLAMALRQHPLVGIASAMLDAQGRKNQIEASMSTEINRLTSLYTDYLALKNAKAGEEPALLNVGLVYDEAQYQKTYDDLILYRVAMKAVGQISKKEPVAGKEFSLQKRVAGAKMVREIVDQYANQVPFELIPYLRNIVEALDWESEEAIAASRARVASCVEELKAWREINPDDTDATGLPAVLQRRQNTYLQMALAGQNEVTFDEQGHGSTMLKDFGRYTLRVNLSTKRTKEAMLQAFDNAIADVNHRKVASALLSQQLFAELTSFIPMQWDLAPLKNGDEPDKLADIKGIGQFASRSSAKEPIPLFIQEGMALPVITIQFAKDGKSMHITATSTHDMRFRVSEMGTAPFGTVRLSQEFDVDFGDPEQDIPPQVKNLKVGQTFV